MRRPPGLSDPQWQLYQEIATAGVLYVTRGRRYHRTVEALSDKGLVRIVEPDYSRNGNDGWSVVGDGLAR